MKRWISALVLMMAHLGLSQPLPLRANQHFAVSPIGAINCRSGLTSWYTTGTLVGDQKTVLTVAHFDTFRRRNVDVAKDLRDCRFTLYDSHGVQSFSSRFELVQRGGSSQTRHLSNATDWAVLTLDHSAPEAVTPLQVATAPDFPSRSEVMIVASSKSERRANKSSRSCLAWPQAERSIVLQHSCPTKGGWSGAPLLVRIDGELKAVGVHSGRLGKFGLAVGFNGHLGERLRAVIHRQSPRALGAATSFRGD